MIYDLLEIIPFAFRLYNKSYDSAILYFNAINRRSARAFTALGPSHLAGRFKRGIKPYTFNPVLQMIRIIRVTYPLVPCNGTAPRHLRQAGLRNLPAP
jgi:hypothetical protein